MSNLEHCVIDGKRCSKCCEVLTINKGKAFRARLKYVRYNGDQSQYDRPFSMTREISKRRAKKINPSLVKTCNTSQSYFICKNFRDGKCQDYENRPKMCSEYPRYNHSEEAWAKWIKDSDNLIGLYREDCTYYDRRFYE